MKKHLILCIGILGTVSFLQANDIQGHLSVTNSLEQLQRDNSTQPKTIAVEILILDLSTDNRELEKQLRNKLRDKNVTFQATESSTKTNGLIFTCGNTTLGIEEIFQVLREITNLEVIANPFFLAGDKTTAHLSISEQSRIGADIVTQNGLAVEATPQINNDETVTLRLTIAGNLINSGNAASDNSSTRSIQATITATDCEVFAIIEKNLLILLSIKQLLPNIDGALAPSIK